MGKVQFNRQIKRNDKVVDFLGIKIDNLTSNEMLDHIDRCVKRRIPCQMVGVNIDQALRVLEDEYSKRIFSDAALVFTDGKPVIWLSKALHTPIVEKVSGPDLMLLICEKAVKENYKIFLLGAGPGVAAKAADNLEKKYKGLQIVGTYSPPFGFEKDRNELEKINVMLLNSKADILFVGLGSPKQDIFIYENMSKYNIPVSFSMGAAIDFIGESIKRAPAWMSKIGLEWFYRFIHSPKRLFRRYFIDDIRILKYFNEFRKKEKERNAYND